MRAYLFALAVMPLGLVPAMRTHTVTQKDKAFSAPTLTVAKGDSVVFRNDDSVVHNVFSADAAFRFNLRTQPPGTSQAVAFATPGSYTVRCAIHPTMKIQVTVQP